ncbi:DUF2442 domain-containing protein [Bradyrhizobium ontarionense]|uniref:DUF2442 domain-containing protein n=1 Tax=Bradyrhizobium ontarionense TaxID=2898149 RepID=A0ABY3RN37_9BRAD|nr:DUF2442 domain-containing protein [Bradyrhizobium sp. A19]
MSRVGLHWETLDEDISVAGLRWRPNRKTPYEGSIRSAGNRLTAACDRVGRTGLHGRSKERIRFC